MIIRAYGCARNGVEELTWKHVEAIKVGFVHEAEARHLAWLWRGRGTNSWTACRFSAR